MKSRGYFWLFILITCAFSLLSACTTGNDVEEPLAANLMESKAEQGVLDPEVLSLPTETVQALNNLSESLPYRLYNDGMRGTIPKMDSSGDLTLWQNYMTSSPQAKLRTEQTESQLSDLISKGLLSDNAAVAAKTMIQDVAGFGIFRQEGDGWAIGFDFPSVHLLIPNDGSDSVNPKLAGIEKSLSLLITNSASKAEWRETDHRDAKDSIFSQYELFLDGLPVFDARITYRIEKDPDTNSHWISRIKVKGYSSIKQISDAVVSDFEESAKIDFSTCNEALIAEIGDDAKEIAENGKFEYSGVDGYRCNEGKCERVSVGSVTNEKGSARCEVGVNSSKVLYLHYSPMKAYQAYVDAFTPYGGESASPQQCGAAEICKASNTTIDLTRIKRVAAKYSAVYQPPMLSACDIASQTPATWTDGSGAFSVGSTNGVCLLPDSRNMPGPWGTTDKSRFAYCEKTNWYTCDGSEQLSNDILLSTKKTPSTQTVWDSSTTGPTYPLTTAVAVDLTRLTTYNTLNRTNRLLRDYITDISLQCKQSSANSYVFYKNLPSLGGNLGEALAPNCSVRYSSQCQNVEPYSSLVSHEYFHVVQENENMGVGEFGGIGGQCYRPGTTQNWGSRQGHGIIHGLQQLIAQYEEDYVASQLNGSDMQIQHYMYPAETGSLQMTQTIFDLGWIIGWPYAIQSFIGTAGLMPNYGDQCRSGYAFLSGFAVRNSRTYVDGSGTDVTSSCACYGSNNPCSCSTIPKHRSERENAGITLYNNGSYWGSYEVDKAFNNRTTETGTTRLDKWVKDLTGIWYGGPMLTNRSKANSAVNEDFNIMYPPNYTTASPDTARLEFRRGHGGGFDQDHVSFLPGYGKTYYFEAHALDGQDLQMQIIDKAFTAVASNDNCTSLTLDPCITWTSYDANTYYIRVWDKTGGIATDATTGGRYYLTYRMVGDDHNDYEPEGTALPLNPVSLTPPYTTGTISANDTDYFRVFVPNNGSFALSSLDVRLCYESGNDLTVNVYRSGTSRHSSGRYRNNTLVATGDLTSSNPCTGTWKSFTYTPGGNITEQWFFVEVKGKTTTNTGAYRIRAGSLSTSHQSDLTHEIDVRKWSDKMYNDDNENFLFRGAGVLGFASSTNGYTDTNADSYLLDFTGWEGRYVTIDAIGLDNGSGASASQLDPILELYPDSDPCNDNGYYNRDGESAAILQDDNGGLRLNYNNIKGAAQLAFRIAKGGKYHLHVKTTSSSNTNKPYLLFVDVKRDWLKQTAMGD